MKLRIPIMTTMTTASFGACPASGLKALSLLWSAWGCTGPAQPGSWHRQKQSGKRRDPR